VADKLLILLRFDHVDESEEGCMAKWVRTIDFSEYEKQFVADEISLQEMARRVYNYLSMLPIYGYETGDDEFTEIVDGGLHTIAFQDEIYESWEELPNVDDYDAWKEELYDWADDVNEEELIRMKARDELVGFSNTPKNAWIVPSL
jgi:pyridoxal biosynthesis lyase PdxS